MNLLSIAAALAVLAAAAYLAIIPVATHVLPYGLVWPGAPAKDLLLTMRASVYEKGGDLDVMDERKVARPAPGKNQIMVQVDYAGGNPVDFKFRREPFFPIVPLPKISGFDFSGVVVDTYTKSGKASEKFRTGDRVHGMLPCPFHTWGTYAEYVSVDEDFAAKVPSSMSMAEAAAVPLAALTAWQALARAPKLKPGNRVLVHAGAGGVGVFLVQFAKAKGLHVTTTCSAGYKLCQKLGADVVIDYKKDSFEQVIAPHSLDAVFDSIGADYIYRSMPLTKPSGDYIEILNDGLLESLGVKSVLHPLYQGTFVWNQARFILAWLLGWGPRYELAVVMSSGKDLEDIDRLIADGKVKVVVDREFIGLGQGARDLHAYLATNKAQGKCVLKVK